MGVSSAVNDPLNMAIYLSGGWRPRRRCPVFCDHSARGRAGQAPQAGGDTHPAPQTLARGRLARSIGGRSGGAFEVAQRRGEGEVVRASLLALGLLCGLAGAAAARADSPALSAADIETYRAAFAAAHAERWGTARSLAAQGQDPLLAKAVEWYVLLRPESNASFDEIASFVAGNPSWPSLNALRERAEEALPEHASAGRAIEWFEQY